MFATWRSLLASFAVAALAFPALAQREAAHPPGAVPGIERERITITISPGGAGPFKLEAMVTKPAGPGRHPLMIWSHGAPRDATDRPKTRANGAAEAVISFAQRGWTVVSLVRRGYGTSEGGYVEGVGFNCRNPDYEAQARVSGGDILEALKSLTKRADVDPSRIVLAGVSAGGFASLGAAAERPAGLAAVLNFAGGRGSNAPDSVCAEDKLAATFGALGARVAVPTFWAYSENDHFFRPEVARRFHAAFVKAGGKAQFQALPAFGEDGHRLTSNEGIMLWRDALDRFLRAQNLPTWNAPIPIPAPFLPPPPGASTHMKADFENYLGLTQFEKAFVIAPRGGFSWRSGKRTAEEAIEEALASCAAKNQGCKVYAVNNALLR